MQVWGDATVGGAVGVNTPNTLPLRDALPHTDLGNDVAVDGLTTTVAGGVINGDPPTEAGCGAGAGDGAVLDGVDRVTAGPATAPKICAPVVAPGTRPEWRRDENPLGTGIVTITFLLT